MEDERDEEHACSGALQACTRWHLARSGRHMHVVFSTVQRVYWPGEVSNVISRRCRSQRTW
jgi:hypothetical protein